MTKLIQAEILVVIMAFLGSIRFLFISHTRKDSIAVVPAVAFIFSIFNVFIYGLSIKELIILCFSFWTALWNFRSVLRLVSDVVIDRYEIKLVLINSLNAIIAVLIFAGIIYFRPAQSNPGKMKVKESVVSYSGSFRNGISKIEGPFKKISAKIWNYETEEETKGARIIVLFNPPKTASVEVYDIFLQKLARNGYSVYAGDFFTKDAEYFGPVGDNRFIRRFLMEIKKMREPEEYKSMVESNINVSVQEFYMLYKIAEPKENDLVFLLTEDDVSESLKSAVNMIGNKINGTFDIAYLEDNKTKGFGPVENTDPLLAWCLGQNPDRSGYISSHLANDVTDFISSQIVGEIQNK